MSTLEADAEEAKECWGVIEAAEKGLEGAARHFLREWPKCVFEGDESGQTALHCAAYAGHSSIVELLLKHGADTRGTQWDGFTPLHFAAEEGRDSAVKLLLQHGADVAAKDKNGETALHKAARRHGSTVELLLEQKADIEGKNKDGSTALHRAAFYGCDSTMELLLKHGADIVAKDKEGETALHVAALHGRNSIVELLLEQKADIEGKNNYGCTALHDAVRNGRDSTVELLLQHGADIGAKDNSGFALLHYAAEKGHRSTVELLLKHGADAGAKPLCGAKPAELAKTDEIKALLREAEEEKEEVAQCKDILDATENGFLKAAEHFLRRDPKCMEAKNPDGLTTLHLAAKHGHTSLVETLLRHGAPLEARDGFGQTALHWAAYCCHVRIVELLASEGASLDVEESDGLTPAKLANAQGHDQLADLLQKLEAEAAEAATCSGGIIQAARDGLPRAVRYFLKDSKSMQQKDKRSGKTALHLAAESGHASIAQMLLTNGAAADARTLDGRTALHFAAANGHTSVAQLLISHGASPYVKGNNGKTPEDVAKEKGHKEITDLLPFHDAGDPARKSGKVLEGGGHSASAPLLPTARSDLKEEADAIAPALREVIQDMLEGPADLEVQRHGCSVISAVCKGSLQDFAVEKGALEALVAALKAHPDTQRWGCLALQHLLQGTAAAARRGRALEAGAVEALLAAPRHALGALGALGALKPALRQMVDGKVVAMLLGAMRDERTAPEAVKALAALARGLAEYAPEEFNSEMKKALDAVSAVGRPDMEKCLDHIRAVYQDVLEECPMDRPEYWSATRSDMVWVAHPVSSEVLSVLTSMFQVHKPEELKKGRDAREYDRTYTDLRVHRAWRIEHQNWMGFTAERCKVQEAMKRIWPQVRLPFWESKLEEASRNLPSRAYLEQTGERFLLHGTKPELILSILHEGFNASLSKGMFGDGCYFAEDPEKIDQYTQPHTKDDGLKELRERLWQDRPHPGGDIFYCFVARVICGATLQTVGLHRSDPQKDATTGANIFATKERRELVHIEGTSPAERYHSLLANLPTEKIDARAIYRFREIVCFKGERIYPEYLLAYQRV